MKANNSELTKKNNERIFKSILEKLKFVIYKFVINS